jgi:hypothetical protein
MIETPVIAGVSRVYGSLAVPSWSQSPATPTLGEHQDGGELVRRLYGHFDQALARERVREAFAAAPAMPVPLAAMGRTRHERPNAAFRLDPWQPRRSSRLASQFASGRANAPPDVTSFKYGAMASASQCVRAYVG